MASNSASALQGRIDRRTLLRAGSIGGVGLSLAQLLRAEQEAGSNSAKACIFIFAWGGPHHLDTFDPKPTATAEIRGPFGSIETRSPGMRLVEEFPRLAEIANHFSLVRSISHTVGEHNAAAYLALTGRLPPADAKGILPSRRSDFPGLGAVVARLRPTNGQIPPYVVAPYENVNLKVSTPGQTAGFLGAAYDPFVIGDDPNRQAFHIPSLALQEGISVSRMADRKSLMRSLDQRLSGLEKQAEMEGFDASHERAFSLISSPQAKNAFDISQESREVRDRYGRFPLGQSLLLARRLVEAGVRIVMVNDADKSGDAFRWDTHNLGGVMPALRRNLPETDVALSALLEDLQVRGMLDDTLVVWMGEMGRTPKSRTGHWTECYPALLAGAGIRGGRVYGESDGMGAYPKSGRCDPADIHATIYRALGLPSNASVTDIVGRSFPLYAGKPIEQLFS